MYVFAGMHGAGLWGEVGHTACSVCLAAPWWGYRAKS